MTRDLKTRGHRGLKERRVSGTIAWVGKVVVAFAMALALSWLPFEFAGERGFRQYLRLKRELSQVKARNRVRAQRIRDLTREVEALKTDDDELERVARDELGLIRDGELVFVVKDVGGR